jgi:hypothetical protein
VSREQGRLGNGGGGRVSGGTKAGGRRCVCSRHTGLFFLLIFFFFMLSLPALRQPVETVFWSSQSVRLFFLLVVDGIGPKRAIFRPFLAAGGAETRSAPQLRSAAGGGVLFACPGRTRGGGSVAGARGGGKTKIHIYRVLYGFYVLPHAQLVSACIKVPVEPRPRVEPGDDSARSYQHKSSGWSLFKAIQLINYEENRTLPLYTLVIYSGPESTRYCTV